MKIFQRTLSLAPPESVSRLAGAKVRLFFEPPKLFELFFRYSCRFFTCLDYHQILYIITHFIIYTCAKIFWSQQLYSNHSEPHSISSCQATTILIVDSEIEQVVFPEKWLSFCQNPVPFERDPPPFENPRAWDFSFSFFLMKAVSPIDYESHLLTNTSYTFVTRIRCKKCRKWRLFPVIVYI